MKRVLIFALLVIGCLLVGCKEQEKFYLNDEFYELENKGITEVDIEEVNSRINNKDNFLLYIFLVGCTTCDELRKILDDYLEDTNLEILSLPYDSMEKGSTLKKTVKYSPSVVIFKNGKIVDFLDTSSDDDTECFRSLEAFKAWLESYIELK